MVYRRQSILLPRGTVVSAGLCSAALRVMFIFIIAWLSLCLSQPRLKAIRRDEVRSAMRRRRVSTNRKTPPISYDDKQAAPHSPPTDNNG